ncbi:hypothetical protein [Segeticoccus rhizosphaerae]|uniref:hypothetical protein n=1 Tax=Segeticoccus rhizosphaerae TaxID=1104777 RepID=UPI0012657F27|nr:hypothetical protein [Segeticoccus rhizosphaerae]
MTQRVSPKIDAAADHAYAEAVPLEGWRLQDRLASLRRELVRGPSAARADEILGGILGVNRALAERIAK